MTKRTRGLLIALPWLSLPLTLGSYRARWGRMPESLAVHFNGSGAPDRFMSRETLLAFAALVTLFVLAQYTFRLSRLREEVSSAGVLISYYLAVLVVTAVFLGLLRYNTR